MKEAAKNMATNWLYEDFDADLLKRLESDLGHLSEQAELESQMLRFEDITQEADELLAFLPTLQEHMVFGFRKFKTLSGCHFDLELAKASHIASPFSYPMSTHDLTYPRMKVLYRLYQHLNPVHFWPSHKQSWLNPPFEGADIWGMTQQEFSFARPDELEFTAFNPCVVLQLLSNTLLEHAEAGGGWADHDDPEALQWVGVAASLLQVVAPDVPVFTPLRVRFSHPRFEFFHT